MVVRAIVVFVALFSLGVSAQRVSAQYVLTNAFSNLTFDSPTDLQADGIGRLFLVEQPGVIRVFDNNEDVQQSTVFLDITGRVSDVGFEEGLLGLAFHPSFASNGFFFVYYTAASPRRAVISRFIVSANDPGAGDPASELVLLEIAEPYQNHNGGQLQFGSDGTLYAGVGDGGDAGDPDGNGQDPTTLLGTILRLDVDNPDPGLNYGIPADNPFVGNGSGFKEEIFAYGFRNPWRFSFDGSTLWAADVGQDMWEEIDTVSSGRNYGWNVMEGAHCYPTDPCDQSGLELPVFEYSHIDGDQSITGGYVYTSLRLPALAGRYVYGDWRSGRIWALQQNGGTYAAELLVDSSIRITTFGRDESGEVLVCSSTGRIFRLEATNTAPAFTSAPVTDATEDDLYSYTVTTTDADGDPVTLSADAIPAWLGLTDNGDGTGLLDGTPGNAEVGVHAVILRADDGTSASTQTFDVFVANTNDAPVITSEPVTSATVGQQYRYDVTADDVDSGDELTFSTPMLAPWMSVGNTTSNTMELLGTPEAADAGTTLVVVRVEDVAGSSAEQSFEVAVRLVNQTPSAVDDMYGVSEGGTLDVPASGVLQNDVDPDGDTLTAVLVDDVVHGTLSLREDGSFDYQHDASETTEDSFTYAASDGTVSSAPALVRITVSPVNDVPEFLPPPPPSTIVQGNLFSYVASVRDDDSEVAFRVDPSLPAWLALSPADPNSVEISGTPDNSHSNNAYEFDLIADDGVAQATLGFSITVQDANDPPGEPVIIAPESGVTIALTESSSEPIDVRWSAAPDPDGDPITYTWQMARTASFTDVLMSLDTDTSTALSIPAQAAYQLLLTENVPEGESLSLVHRARASDGIVLVDGPPSNVTLMHSADTGTEDVVEGEFKLLPSHPNPFSVETTITFELPIAGPVRLIVYDALGREVTRLVEAIVPAGVHNVRYVPVAVPSGLYVVRLESVNGTLARVMTYIR